MKKLTDESTNIGRKVTTKNGNQVTIIDFYRKDGKIIYIVECDICKYQDGRKYTYEIIKGNLIPKGRNCPCCSNKRLVPEINSVFYKRRDLLKYFVNIEDAKTVTHGENKRIIDLKCPTCGEQKSMTMNRLTNNGFSCKKCSSGISYPNAFMRNVLTELNVEFESEYSPDWIKPKRYDFYIPGHNIIIEMDGGLGHGKRYIKGCSDNDEIKDNLAKEHGLRVIRIDCDYGHNERFDYIKSKTIEKIKEIINLDNICWSKIRELSENNIIKDVCLYYKNIEASIDRVADKFELHKTTIIEYLKRGSEIGWCDYDPEEAKRKRYSAGLKTTAIKIICIENGVVFNGYAECQEKSLEIFGVHINRKHVSEHIRGLRKDCKGYTFKRV